ncbi:MAG: MFS transporter, partial [Pseudomonadota bacterium]
DGDGADEAPPSMLGVLKFLLTRRTFIHLSMAAGLHAFVGYGVGSFLISFYVRSYNIPTDEISSIAIPLGLVVGIGGALGGFLGGYAADRLGRVDKRWYVWVPGLATLIAVPFGAAAILQADLELSIGLYALPLVLGYMYLGPTLAATHALVRSRMRAIASAVLFFIVNLIGLGLGPTTVGVLSDWLTPIYGVESLRYSLLIVFAVYLWSALHYFLASRTLREDFL